MDNFYCSWDEPTLVENMWNIWDCMTRHRNEIGVNIYKDAPLVVVGLDSNTPLPQWDRVGIWIDTARVKWSGDIMVGLHIEDDISWMGDWKSAYIFSLLCKLELNPMMIGVV